MIVISKTKNMLIGFANKLFHSPHRTVLFGLLGFLFSSAMLIANLLCKLYLSSLFLSVLLICISAILILDYYGFRRYIRMAYVVSINLFTTLTVYCQGLAGGGYLLLIVMLVALAFLLENVRNYKRQVFRYFAITITSFVLCILFCPYTSKWEHISPTLYHYMFITNCVTVIVLVSMFCYIGVTLERKARHSLILEKDIAKAQAERISTQNQHLRDIAFISAHTLRSPLTNILSIVNMLDTKGNLNSQDFKLIQYLKRSANDLDEVIHEIVEKTSSIEAEMNSFPASNWVI